MAILYFNHLGWFFLACFFQYSSASIYVQALIEFLSCKDERLFEGALVLSSESQSNLNKIKDSR